MLVLMQKIKISIEILAIAQTEVILIAQKIFLFIVFLNNIKNMQFLPL